MLAELGRFDGHNRRIAGHSDPGRDGEAPAGVHQSMVWTPAAAHQPDPLDARQSYPAVLDANNYTLYHFVPIATLDVSAVAGTSASGPLQWDGLTGHDGIT